MNKVQGINTTVTVQVTSPMITIKVLVYLKKTVRDTRDHSVIQHYMRTILAYQN